MKEGVGFSHAGRVSEKTESVPRGRRNRQQASFSGGGGVAGSFDPPGDGDGVPARLKLCVRRRNFTLR